MKMRGKECVCWTVIGMLLMLFQAQLADCGSKKNSGVIVINNSGGGQGSTNTIVKSNGGGKKGKKGGNHDIILSSGGGKCGSCGCGNLHKTHHKIKHIPIPIMMHGHHHGWKSGGWW